MNAQKRFRMLGMNTERYQFLYWGFFSFRNWSLRLGRLWPEGDRDPKLICSFRAFQIGPVEIRRWCLTDEEAAQHEE